MRQHSERRDFKIKWMRNTYSCLLPQLLFIIRLRSPALSPCSCGGRLKREREREREDSEPRDIKNGRNTPFLPEHAPQHRTLWLPKPPFNCTISGALSSLSLPVAVAVSKIGACHRPSPLVSAVVVAQN